MAHMEHRIRHPKQVSVHNLRSSFTRQAQTNHDDRRIVRPCVEVETRYLKVNVWLAGAGLAQPQQGPLHSLHPLHPLPRRGSGCNPAAAACASGEAAAPLGTGRARSGRGCGVPLSMVTGVPVPRQHYAVISTAVVVALLPSSITMTQPMPAASEPNPPVWPGSVFVFTPTTPAANITATVNAVFNENGGRKDRGQFSSDRYALLFMPGSYEVDVPVGYYTQVLGLGESPTDVVFTGDKGVYCEEGDFDIDVGALDTFWRGAENFQTNSKHLWTDTEGMLWSVSQAAPLRRLVIKNNLKLFEYKGGGAAGYASGGFLADSVVEGLVASGSQQQWLTRNSLIGKWIEGVSWDPPPLPPLAPQAV
jgi:hypothetical protein